MPACFPMSSLHLFVGRPAVLNPFLGRQSVHLFVHLLSEYLAMCPAKFHFCVSACFKCPLSPKSALLVTNLLTYLLLLRRCASTVECSPPQTIASSFSLVLLGAMWCLHVSLYHLSISLLVALQSKPISWSPVCTSFCSSVVWISGDVSCPIPFLCQCVFEDICYSCLLSNSCAWNFILESYV